MTLSLHGTNMELIIPWFPRGFDSECRRDYPPWKCTNHKTGGWSHVAARIYLVFCPLSSRVSPRQPHRFRGAHGLSLCAFFRVLQPEAIGGFSRYSPSKVLGTVEGLERIFSERNAYSFYDQAGSGASQACSDQKCRDAVKSGGNMICWQQCQGSFWQTLAMYLELVQWSMPWCGAWSRRTRHCLNHQSYGFASSLTLLFQTRALSYE